MEAVFTPQFIWWIFGAVAVVTALLSAVFLYHWTQYGFGDRKIKIMGTLYFIVAAVLLLAAFMTLSSYISSL